MSVAWFSWDGLVNGWSDDWGTSLRVAWLFNNNIHYSIHTSKQNLGRKLYFWKLPKELIGNYRAMVGFQDYFQPMFKSYHPFPTENRLSALKVTGHSKIYFL